MAVEKRHYTAGLLTVVWQPALCIHCGNCVRGLETVFNRFNHPWVNMQGAEPDIIIEQVKKCPSGALSFTLDEKVKDNKEK